MVVAEGRYAKAPANKSIAASSTAPTITMRSEIRKPDDSQASEGDYVGSIHVDVTIENKTSKTFVFPKREIIFEITKDGQHFDTLTTSGPGFAMTPGGKMMGQFDRPIAKDGTYSWRAKTWFTTK